MGANNNIIAIVWAPHEARTAMFADRLGASLFNIHYLQYKRPLVAPIKYIAQWFKTWLVLLQQRPRYVYITNPPVLAALCVALYCAVSRADYIMDTHPPALYSRKWGWTKLLQRFLSRFAVINVVDQERFKELFETWGAKAVALESPPKHVPTNVSGQVDRNYFDIIVVNTFAEDEPVEPILEAAKQLPPTVRFFITGDTARAKPQDIANPPPNVTFTGYLWREEYWRRVNSSRAVMALTTYPYSLLQAAHEGLVLSKPLILSNQPALTEYFPKGAVFVENTAASIVAGVKAAQEKEAQLSKELAALSEEHQQRWDRNFKQLSTLLRTQVISLACILLMA